MFARRYLDTVNDVLWSQWGRNEDTDRENGGETFSDNNNDILLISDYRSSQLLFYFICKKYDSQRSPTTARVHHKT